MKNKIGYGLALLLSLSAYTACNETATDTALDTSNLSSTGDDSDSSATITAIDTASSTVLTNYTVANFSKNIYLHNTEGKILVAYDFFPEGSDVCQQATYDEKTNPNGCQVAKTVVMPCEYQSVTGNDLLSVNLNAPTETTACDNKIVVDMGDAEFTVNGLVFTGSSVGVFEDDFEFKITRDGFVDTSDNAALSFSSDDVGLEEVYEKIVLSR